jgi:hypothetical protein
MPIGTRRTRISELEIGGQRVGEVMANLTEYQEMLPGGIPGHTGWEIHATVHGRPWTVDGEQPIRFRQGVTYRMGQAIVDVQTSVGGAIVTSEIMIRGSGELTYWKMTAPGRSS